MVTTNKKFINELKNIITSTDKAKKVALAEIDKIDAKYKALAEKEKASLSKTIKLLESQLTMYNDMIKADNDSVETEETVASAEQVSEKEATIEDTVFPENNETVFDIEVKATEKDVQSESTETVDVEDSEDTDSVEWPDDTVSEDTAAPSEPTADESDNTTESEDESEQKSEDEWPEFPEEWK